MLQYGWAFSGVLTGEDGWRVLKVCHEWCGNKGEGEGDGVGWESIDGVRFECWGTEAS